METPTNITPAATFSTQSESIQNIVTALCYTLPKIPKVEKNHKARIRSTKGADSSYEYSYADLSDILAVSTNPMAENGLVVTWSSQPAERGSLLFCTLWHTSGEWMRAGLMMPPMANPQETGSMLSYLKRYLFGLLVPVAATEADDDGQRAARGHDDDEVAQSAILEAKRAEREAIASEGKKSGRYTKVAKVEEQKLADAGLAPVTDATQIVGRGYRTTDNVVVRAEPEKAKPADEAAAHATPPPELPAHINELIFMLTEAAIPVEKFVHWATHPRPAVGKGRLLPEGTKLENFPPDLVKAVTAPQAWSKVISQIK